MKKLIIIAIIATVVAGCSHENPYGLNGKVKEVKYYLRTFRTNSGQEKIDELYRILSSHDANFALFFDKGGYLTRAENNEKAATFYFDSIHHQLDSITFYADESEKGNLRLKPYSGKIRVGYSGKKPVECEEIKSFVKYKYYSKVRDGDHTSVTEITGSDADIRDLMGKQTSRWSISRYRPSFFVEKKEVGVVDSVIRKWEPTKAEVSKECLLRTDWGIPKVDESVIAHELPQLSKPVVEVIEKDEFDNWLEAKYRNSNGKLQTVRREITYYMD